MKIKHILLFVFISTYIVSCNTESDQSVVISDQPNMKNGNNRKHEIFSNYVENKLNLCISNELHYFVLVPNFGCEGCMIKTLIEMDSIINDGNKALFTFISTNNEIIPDGLFEKVTIIEDTTKYIERINIGLANITLIETEKGKVNFIKSVKLSDLPVKKFLRL